MSISNQIFSEKLLEGYVNTPPSIKEQSMTRLAIQMCQHSLLKKCIVEDFDRQFKCNWPASEWKLRLEDQSYAVCETLPLPRAFKSALIDHIRLIIIRLLGWNREYRIRFAMTYHIVEEMLTFSDWTAEGRIDEIKVTERLVVNEAIPINQRYIIACLRFMVPFIRPLWNELSYKNKRAFCNDQGNPMYGHSNLVKLWSFYMSGRLEEFIGRGKRFYQRGFKDAVREGQRTAVVYCWNRLRENTKQKIIVSSALCAWKEYDSLKRSMWIKKTKNYVQRWKYELHHSKHWYATPTHYSDILYFLVSQMSQTQMKRFFQHLYNLTDAENSSSECDPTFSWSLESPYQRYFVPIITKLWDILPESCYIRLLIQLSIMYGNIHSEEEYKDYDYGNLLVELFERTPDRYYRYIFSKSDTILAEIFSNILAKTPFQHKNIEIIENVLQHATVNEKRSVMHSSSGEYVYYYLIKTGSREVLDRMLSDCFPEKEIAEFRKKFMLSCKGREACFGILNDENKEEYLNSLLKWANFSPEDISDFKPNLIWNVFLENGLSINSLLARDRDYFNSNFGILGQNQRAWDPRNSITILMEKFDTESVDRVLEWCLPSEDARNQYKDQFMSILKEDNSYNPLSYIPFSKCSLKCLNSKISQFLCWAFSSEEERKLFKQKLFAKKFPQKVLGKSILHEQWQDVDFFIKLFEVSHKETMQLKRNVMWNGATLYNIFDLLCKSETEIVSHYLKWGLSNSRAVNAFKIKFHDFLCVFKEINRAQKDWDQLINDRLKDLAINRTLATGRRKRVCKNENSSCKLLKRQ